MSDSDTTMAFWEEKGLTDLSADEWEALCDGCGRCCMWKFEDEDTGEILYTDIRCRLFDGEICRCTDYEHRFEQVPDCLNIRTFSPEQYSWLPESCAYRLLFEGRPLPSWHPLISGNQKEMRDAGLSMLGRTVSGDGLSEEEAIARIIAPDTDDE